MEPAGCLTWELGYDFSSFLPFASLFPLWPPIHTPSYGGKSLHFIQTRKVSISLIYFPWSLFPFPVSFPLSPGPFALLDTLTLLSYCYSLVYISPHSPTSLSFFLHTLSPSASVFRSSLPVLFFFSPLFLFLLFFSSSFFLRQSHYVTSWP